MKYDATFRAALVFPSRYGEFSHCVCTTFSEQDWSFSRIAFPIMNRYGEVTRMSQVSDIIHASLLQGRCACAISVIQCTLLPTQMAGHVSPSSASMIRLKLHRQGIELVRRLKM